jgi:RHS repeat-associated protein
MNLQYSPTDLSPMHFTGKQHDPESGLDNFGARYYGSSNALGRFMSVDPENVGADSSDPQTWNAYAYVRNNPATLTDPLGLFSNVPTGCFAVPDNNPEGSSHVVCPDDQQQVPFIPFVTTTIWPNSGTGRTSPNSGLTLGIRQPGQTFNDCMKANAGNYSLLGVADFALGANGQIADNFWLGLTPASNTVSGVYNAATGSLSSLLQTGPMVVQGGMGSAVTYGRRTSSIMSLNLSGTPGGPAGGFPALGSAPSNSARLAAKAASYLKLAVDTGFALAEAVGCSMHP